MITRRHMMAAGTTVAALAGLHQKAHAFTAEAAALKPHDLDDFFGKADIFDTALSPDGKHIALALNRPEDPRDAEARKKLPKGAVPIRKTVVAVVDGDDTEKVIRSIDSGAYEVESVLWAKKDRLLIWLSIDVTPPGEPKGSLRARRILAMAPDGSASVVLFENKRAMRNVYDLGELTDILAEDPTHILMSAWDPDHEVQALFRLDVYTGAAELIERGTAATTYWWTQNGVAMVRFDENERGTVVTVMGRAPGEKSWKKIRKFRLDQTPDFFIVGAAQKPGAFLVGAVLEGEDTVSIRELDLTNVSFGPPIASRPGADAVGAVADQYKRYLGAMYYDDRLSYDFVDKAFASHFRGLDRYFDNSCNLVFTDVDLAQNRFLIRATGPREPGAWALYDRATKQISSLGSVRPRLKSERLAPVEALRVRTRDGAEISAYLTMPLSKAPGPLIVMPHGGPELRDHLTYDVWGQVLAAQGWWVLQPNFRGSGGYGLAFAKAGWGRWGDRMQDDLEDAALHAIAKHGLDKARVALFGGSYGGYAALMSGTLRPHLYKASVSVAGISDLPDFLKWRRAHDNTPDKDIDAFWRARIGDPDKNAAQLLAASPRRRAAEFAIPLLLIHGDEDDRVPVEQSRAMARAMKAAGKPCDYWEVKGVGHSGWPDEQEKELLRRSIAFLGKALA